MEDLRAASEGYHNEAETMRRIGQGSTPSMRAFGESSNIQPDPREYEYSQTRRQFNQDIPISDPYYSASVYSQGPGYPPGNSYPPVTGPGYSSLTYATNPPYPAYTTMGSTSGAVPAMYPNMSTEDPRYSNYIYSQTNQGFPPERYPQYPSDPRYEAQQPPRGYGSSVQDPSMGRTVDRPTYYEPPPLSNPYNSNPATSYARQGQSSYEAPPTTRGDPYRPGPQQNQYESRRR